jgi:ribosomal protein S15P/S13E
MATYQRIAHLRIHLVSRARDNHNRSLYREFSRVFG